MTAAEVLAECREMVTEILPELGHQPTFYFCDLADTGFPADAMGGVFIRHLTCNIHNIPDWRGPGPLMAIDFASFSAGHQPHIGLAQCKAATIHEAAHWHPVSDDSKKRLEAIPHEIVRASLREDATVPAEEVASVVRHHGPRYVRKAYHLWYRATAFGHAVQPRDVLAYDDWLSPLQFYMPAFIDGCVRLRFAPLSVIDAEPIPQLAKALHAGDLERYRESQAKEKVA